MASRRAARDVELVQIVDACLADATTRGGDWLACRPGCSQCCHGVFAISALDALRLRDGLASLTASDPVRAGRVRGRAEASVALLREDFPGDPATGILGETEMEQERFAHFANEMPCPVLDPQTGTCDLYAARPMTCRVFGPPVLSAEGLSVCELCFVGADESVIIAAEMRLDHTEIEEELNLEAEQATRQGSTIVAFALCD